MAHQHNPEVRLQPKGKFPGPLIAIIVAAAILAAIIYYLPRTQARPAPPAGAEVPAQATGRQIQISHLEINPDPTGNSARLRGMLTNTGRTSINSIELTVDYQDKNGRSAGTEDVPAVAVDKQGQTEDLGSHPIEPGETRAFQVTLARVPPQWNHEVPAVQVKNVLASKP